MQEEHFLNLVEKNKAALWKHHINLEKLHITLINNRIFILFTLANI